ncbi:hypothetical protein [uncultured Jatrophihabitans sp.]|uniref:hypothetical protein n=1 Tax=uncultured Jatrophihabitans sp. TaxID=1610747 RepID=UPI0035CBEFD3
MIEATDVQSLLMRAKRLTALSRAKGENAKETQEQGQAETALNNLKAELAKLDNVLAAHRKLREAGAPVADLPDLTASAQRLRDHVESTGRPTHQFLNARKADVSKAATDIAAANQQAWRSWASDEIANLPLAALPKLNPSDRQQATNTLDTMRRSASASQVSSGDVTTFRLALANVAELLAGVGASESDGVLSRFETRRILLSQLSDEELTTLRSDEALKDQLYVVIS